MVAVYTASDIPGENNCGPIIHDDPFLAVGKVEFLGQAVAVVVARDMLYAREAAKKAVVNVKELPAILTIDEAMAAKSFVMPPKGITRGTPAEAIKNAPHTIKGQTTCGQQEQFYLEGQITYAVPREDGQLTLYVSTQHPDGNQREAAAALNLTTNDVEVICRRMGGGFGGKEGNASIFSQSAALAAFKLQKPVKLRVNRDDDMMITGKRHDFRIDYEAGFDDEGRILGIDVTLASRCGYSTDYSGPVNDRAVLHIDNCYYLPNLSIISHRCKTNMQSATAFRGFGGPQGMFGIETVIEQIARKIGKDPLEVRKVNLYQEPAVSGNPATLTTQYGQDIEDWIGDKVMAQVEAESNYSQRRLSVDSYNKTSKYKKKGIALVPLKFGISFTATMLNQGGALLNIYMDGSVSVNHGGIEMGQGLNTKIAQIAADGLGIPVDFIRVTGTDTQKVPNASATAASSGADINGAAVNNACDQMRVRLAAVAARMLNCTPDTIKFIAGQAINTLATAENGTKTAVSWKELGQTSLAGPRWPVGDRFLHDAGHQIRLHDPARQGVLLLLLRRSGDRGRNRHPHGRVVAAKSRHRARRRQIDQPCYRFRADRRRVRARHGLADDGRVHLGHENQSQRYAAEAESCSPTAPAPTKSLWRATFLSTSRSVFSKVKTSNPHRSRAKPWASHR